MASAENAASAGAPTELPPAAPATWDANDAMPEPREPAVSPRVAPPNPVVGPLAAEPRAMPAQDSWSARRLAFEAHLGVATPVSMIGLIVEYSISPLLGVGAGVGYGPGNGSRLRGALVSRLRPLHWQNDALTIGAAYCLGDYLRLDHLIKSNEEYYTRLAHWLQADIGWEHRASKGFVVRLAIGAALLLNPSDLLCKGDEDDVPHSCGTSFELLPTFDVGLGYAL